MLKKIREELDYVREAKVELKRRIGEAPIGRLRCAVCRGNYQYYIGKRYLRSKDKKIAVQLAEKDYAEKILQELEKFEQVLRNIEDFMRSERLQNIYRELHPARQILVKPIYRPVEQVIEEFEQLQYEGKYFKEEDKTSYYTIKGERVRSKSEKIIADELCRHEIPYKYELPIELQTWNKKIIIYPDFTVLNKRSGKKFILEHLGMMDKESYFENSIQKLDVYEKNNILLGRDLILLHETSSRPLDTKILTEYIKEYLY